MRVGLEVVKPPLAVSIRIRSRPSPASTSMALKAARLELVVGRAVVAHVDLEPVRVGPAQAEGDPVPRRGPRDDEGAADDGGPDRRRGCGRRRRGGEEQEEGQRTGACGGHEPAIDAGLGSLVGVDGGHDVWLRGVMGGGGGGPPPIECGSVSYWTETWIN